MIIGRFSESADGTHIGHIRTMLFKSDKVVFEPIADAASPKAPAYRVYTGDEIELGAAWRMAGKESGAVYYDVELDDPTFAKPIFCRLVQPKQGAGFLLVWERTRRRTKTDA